MAVLSVRAVCGPAAAVVAVQPLAEQHGIRGIQPLVVPWYRLQGQETAAQRSVAGPSAQLVGEHHSAVAGPGRRLFQSSCQDLCWKHTPGMAWLTSATSKPNRL